MIQSSPQTNIVSKKEAGEVLIRAENVSKKLCKDLKKSLWYGLQDMSSEMLGRRRKEVLRDKEFWAVDDVSFELRRGECMGLVGKNGAGKSTLLKMLNGLIKPDKGKITLLGRIGSLIELNAGFNPILTGRENMYINGAILGFSKEEVDEKFDDILDFAEIGDFIDTPVQNYSSGMRVRLGFAIASHMEPDILLIDEVLAVGDMAFRQKCLNKLKEMLNFCCVIFVTHGMVYIREVCNCILLLDKGKIAFWDHDIEKGTAIYDAFSMTEEEKEALEKRKEEGKKSLEEQRKKEEEIEKEVPPVELISCELYEVGNPNNTKVFEQFCELELNVVVLPKTNLIKHGFAFAITNSQSEIIIASRSELYDYIENKTLTVKAFFKNNLIKGEYSLNFYFFGKNKKQMANGTRSSYLFENCIQFTVIGNQGLLNSQVQIKADWSKAIISSDSVSVHRK